MIHAIHFLPKSVLKALLRILVWLRVADDLKIDVWAAIRAHEIAEERGAHKRAHGPRR